MDIRQRQDFLLWVCRVLEEGGGVDEFFRVDEAEDSVGGFEAGFLVAVVQGLVESHEGFDDEGSEAIGGGLVDGLATAVELRSEGGRVASPTEDGGAVDVERGGDGGVGLAREDEPEGGLLLGGEGRVTSAGGG